MRTIIIAAILGITTLGYAQENGKISTMDFVQIVDKNKAEAMYYFQNNWEVLRNMAIKKGYIHSYQFLESPIGEGEPFQFIFVTTYLNKEQYDLREKHFSALIKERGQLKLMNDKQPDAFRKSLFTKEEVRHWN